MTLKRRLISLGAAFVLIGAAVAPAAAAVRIDGQVQAGGGPVANSTVTLWAASGGEPQQLAQAKTADDGSFALNADATPGPGVSLYLVAKGGVAAVNKSARRQSGAGVPGGARRRASGQGRRQRDDDHRFGLDQRAVPRRRGDQGAGAESRHRRRQRARTSSISRPAATATRLRNGLNSSADADARQFRYAIQRAGRLRHAGQGHRLRQPVCGRDGAGRQDAGRHADGGRVHRARALVSARKRSSPCSVISIPRRRASRRCGRRLSSPISLTLRAPGSCRSSSPAGV